jgi:hypothetical protein
MSSGELAKKRMAKARAFEDEMRSREKSVAEYVRVGGDDGSVSCVCMCACVVASSDGHRHSCFPCNVSFRGMYVHRQEKLKGLTQWFGSVAGAAAANQKRKDAAASAETRGAAEVLLVQRRARMKELYVLEQLQYAYFWRVYQ